MSDFLCQIVLKLFLRRLSLFFLSSKRRTLVAGKSFKIDDLFTFFSNFFEDFGFVRTGHSAQNNQRIFSLKPIEYPMPVTFVTAFNDRHIKTVKVKCPSHCTAPHSASPAVYRHFLAG